MKLRTAKLHVGMYFVDFIYNHTRDVDNPAEFLKGPSAYTIVLLLEQRNISQLQT